MSLTGVSPIINSWIERGLEWTWFWRPVQRPFEILAKSHIQIPSSAYTFNAPEGTLLTLNGIFDHPSCGIRAHSHPGLDTGDVFTVNLMALVGFANAPMYLSAAIPPHTPPGIYSILQQKEWPWTEWAKLYLFNSDTVSHRCIGYSYTMAMLKKPRSVEKEAQ